MDLGKSSSKESEGPSRRSGTLKELCFDDKQKVANIIKQVVSLKEDADRNQKIRKEEHSDFQRRLKELNDRNKEVIRENASLKSKLLQALAMVRTYQHKVRAIEVSQRLKQSDEITNQISFPKVPPVRSSGKKLQNSLDGGLEVIFEGGNSIRAAKPSKDFACQTSPADIEDLQSPNCLDSTKETSNWKYVDGQQTSAAVQTDSTERMASSKAVKSNLGFQPRSAPSEGDVSDATLCGFHSELDENQTEHECESDTTSLLGDIIKRRLKQKKALADASNQLAAAGRASTSIASQIADQAPSEKNVGLKISSTASSIVDGSLGSDSDVGASKPVMSFDPGAGPRGSFYLKPEVNEMSKKIQHEGRHDGECTAPTQQVSVVPQQKEDGQNSSEESEENGVSPLLTSPIKDSVPAGTSSDIHVHHHVHISPAPPPPSGTNFRHSGDHEDDQPSPALAGSPSQEGNQFDASLMDLVSEVEALLDKGDPAQSQISRRMDVPSYHQSVSPGSAFIDETDLIRALLLHDM